MFGYMKYLYYVCIVIKKVKHMDLEINNKDTENFTELYEKILELFPSNIVINVKVDELHVEEKIRDLECLKIFYLNELKKNENSTSFMLDVITKIVENIKSDIVFLKSKIKKYII